MNRQDVRGFVGESQPMQELFRFIEHVARTDATVLVRGESGVGKELVAQAVHRLSAVAHQAFIVVDCAALHENLLQSELFGHERGAYTGAVELKHGLFEAAHRGTLFLDEIGELSTGLQVMLLRVLETGTFRRLGGLADIHVDVRVIAATNRSLERMIEKGEFREDLFYRLNVFPLEVPALREHANDIPLLVRHFIGASRTPDVEVANDAMDLLVAYRWPGNVRELENVVERALILSNGGPIESAHLPLTIRRGGVIPYRGRVGETLALHDLELRHILRVLEGFQGHRERAAAALGISERTLYRRLKESDALHRNEDGDTERRGNALAPLEA